jgi:hypothetical protein
MEEISGFEEFLSALNISFQTTNNTQQWTYKRQKYITSEIVWNIHSDTQDLITVMNYNILYVN